MKDIQKIVEDLREHAPLKKNNKDLMIEAAEALEFLLKEKNEIFSQISDTERNMSIDLEKAIKTSIDLECENFYIKKAIQNMMCEVDAAKGCYDRQGK